MRGQVLGVDTRTGEGMVAGEDGRRYAFRPEDWAHRGSPAVGLHVDFEAQDSRALSLFPAPPVASAVTTATPATAGRPAVPATDRSKLVAALLACPFLIGVLGLHRFYLGRTGSAIVMLVLSITVVGMLATWPWALVDMIRYLTMSDDEFAARYARRPR